MGATYASWQPWKLSGFELCDQSLYVVIDDRRGLVGMLKAVIFHFFFFIRGAQARLRLRRRCAF